MALSEGGSVGLTSHSVIANWTLCVCQRNEDDPWDTSDGSSTVKKFNLESAIRPTGVNAFILYPNHKSKTLDPFDFRSSKATHIGAIR